ncbi:hypothetical protein GCM10010264_16850 [Streptomyces globisporus]|nr:hypothetical protein GCM10010264_16850 [Streptomyces globisporus]
MRVLRTPIEGMETSVGAGRSVSSARGGAVDPERASSRADAEGPAAVAAEGSADEHPARATQAATAVSRAAVRRKRWGVRGGGTEDSGIRAGRLGRGMGCGAAPVRAAPQSAVGSALVAGRRAAAQHERARAR